MSLSPSYGPPPCREAGIALIRGAVEQGGRYPVWPGPNAVVADVNVSDPVSGLVVSGGPPFEISGAPAELVLDAVGSTLPGGGAVGRG